MGPGAQWGARAGWDSTPAPPPPEKDGATAAAADATAAAADALDVAVSDLSDYASRATPFSPVCQYANPTWTKYAAPGAPSVLPM